MFGHMMCGPPLAPAPKRERETRQVSPPSQGTVNGGRTQSPARHLPWTWPECRASACRPSSQVHASRPGSLRSAPSAASCPSTAPPSSALLGAVLGQGPAPEARPEAGPGCAARGACLVRDDGTEAGAARPLTRLEGRTRAGPGPGSQASREGPVGCPGPGAPPVPGRALPGLPGRGAPRHPWRPLSPPQMALGPAPPH